MPRLALSVLLVAAISPVASAEDGRTLGVTVSPVGAWAATRLGTGVTSGLSASIDWNYRRSGAWTALGGHVASSAIFTEATPVRLRWGPPSNRFQPYVGIGASLMLPWRTASGEALHNTSLRLGAEVSAGADVKVTELVFLAGECRYQNFSAQADPLNSVRQEIFSAYLGVGFQL